MFGCCSIDVLPEKLAGYAPKWFDLEIKIEELPNDKSDPKIKDDIGNVNNVNDGINDILRDKFKKTTAKKYSTTT